MAKKRSTKRSRHQNFKLTSHRYSKQQVYMYIVGAIIIGLAIGYLIKDQTMAVLGISTY
ncbi:MAG: hypothetical protein Q7S74_00285 [Nanoarchaeota archaeon]|nr:hypothetical protein [Nanoarchaeota archaeon]